MEHVEQGDVTEGQILFEGVRIDPHGPHRHRSSRHRAGARGPQDPRAPHVEQNLLVGSHLNPDFKQVKADMELVYSYFPKMATMKTNTSGYLSGGEQQMLVLGRALMARPKLILLDETVPGAFAAPGQGDIPGPQAA